MKKFDLEIYCPEYGAGSTHGWDKHQYGIRGIGIATYRFNNKPRLKVKVEGTLWAITLKRVKEFIAEYPKSVYTTKGIKLYVIPMSIMEVLEEAPYVPKYVAPPEDKQPKLF